MPSSRSCPICASLARERLYQRRFSKLSDGLLEGYDVVVCTRCGFCFADQLPSQAEFDCYYARQSKYEHEHRRGEQSEFDTRHRPATAAVISEWLPEKRARIADLGCANGDLLAELKRQGYEDVTGVDPSPICARAAAELYGINVFTAPISAIPSEAGTFDFVILGSVLEHILDLNGTIECIEKVLRPGGAVYLEVPDMTRCSLINDAPFQEFSVEHINFFGPISLRNLWQVHGFSNPSMQPTAMEQVPGLTIYDIKAMFRRSTESVGELEFDDQTSIELRRYIERGDSKLAPVRKKIDSLRESRQPIIVWGVGTHTQSLLATTSLKDANIQAFVDSNTRYVGQTIRGSPILSIEDVKRLPHDILVSSQQFQSEIVEQIHDRLMLPNNIMTLY